MFLLTHIRFSLLSRVPIHILTERKKSTASETVTWKLTEKIKTEADSFIPNSDAELSMKERARTRQVA
jgi:hypothetical protein